MTTSASTSVIYIPDISGFSKFVNDIEILHGQEITAELLEEIINAEELGFEISEIEGDAILFYKIGDPISIEEIYNQSLKILQKFHKKKMEVQEKRICRCNACQSVNNLTLKFILHFDNVELINVNRFKKLYGRGVILAHRLMKNDVKENEYIIFTKNYPNSDNTNKEIFEVCPIKQNLEGIGDVDCQYIKLNLPN